jgi:hypothetical protein
MRPGPLPIPPFFDPGEVGRLWKVPMKTELRSPAVGGRACPAAGFRDEFRISLVLVDVQNTFCLPDFELFVGGAPEPARWMTIAACASSSTRTWAGSARSRPPRHPPSCADLSQHFPGGQGRPAPPRPTRWSV